ncbi:phosphate ABC transporter permease PstA [Actinomadura madurae]|uniref:phosphate ABC transporter permease PstA n=1 Tax=Actinomadura madurae TaxID=1993 RepID=UPI002027322E|nr:phosphate ABC transporter permease PstA [Actinomadura madurae]MCP9950841.1 phosphate ABC transporter permease PstA [Actinomadura madurae]MCP9967624.1 phosphate ABC transporter permease PstA [Actinomadura madurae]MCP9980074.1 phosphate ABC transporter permease PstA [Actinomadura madurae]MCQ0008397.1 phosphate ABC transporter permease PstA [Actinomadura madurae]MCQ0016288.1 phosphate ABC transporter permease PstA [Actinomadura madurae]
MTTVSTGRSAPDTSLTSVSAGRRVKDRAVQALVYLAFALALIPLLSVLWTVVVNGAERLDPTFFQFSMNAVSGSDPGGGAYHAIIGTLEQVAITSLIAVPIAVLTAIYLVEYAGSGRLGKIISFTVDVMTGIPSIVAGLFVLALWLLTFGFDFSGLAGSLALTILMIPTVVRATEEMLKLVPNDLREASYALGVPRWRTVCFVVLPTAMTGIVTGVMLAVARVMGETAPLLLTIFFTKAINNDPLNGPQASLPTFIWEQAADPNQNSIDRAWTGALVLIGIIMLLNLVARFVARRKAPAGR